MTIRHNPDLDAAFGGNGESVNAFPRKKKTATRRKGPGLDRDKARRLAFRVLAIIADLDAKQRAQVLRAAERLNRA